jgi:hypothetical protein
MNDNAQGARDSDFDPSLRRRSDDTGAASPLDERGREKARQWIVQEEAKGRHPNQIATEIGQKIASGEFKSQTDEGEPGG